MKRLEQNFGKWILKYRWLVVIGTLTLVLLAATGSRHLRFTTDYRVYFSDDNPELIAFDSAEKTYSKNDNVFMVLTPENGNVFTYDTMRAVEWLTQQAWQTPYSIRVDSITNFQYSRAENDDLIVGNLVPDATVLSPNELKRVRDIALTEPLLLDRLINPEGSVTGVNITVQLPGTNETREAPEVAASVRKLSRELRTLFPTIKVHMSGMVMMNTAFSESSKLDMTTLIPLSFVVMLLSLGFLTKGFSGTFATLNVIGLSIVTAMGLGGYMGFPLSPPSVSAPIIILTVAIANSVHILVSLLQLMRSGKPKHDAIIESLRINLQPVTLASATTAIGFLTMNFSDVPPFQHLGNFVAFGVFASLILSLTFLPALLSFLPVRVKTSDNRKSDSMARLGEFIVSYRKPFLWGTLVAIVALVSVLPRNELNDVFINYFDTSVPFRSDTDYISENLSGTYSITYSLDSGEKGGVSDPAFMQDVEAFALWFRNQESVQHVNTFTDILKRLNKNMHQDNSIWYELPNERDLAAQYLLMYEMSLPYGLDLNNQINIDKSATRFVATMQTMSSKGVQELVARADAWLKANTTHIKAAVPTGPSVMFANIGQRNIKSMLLGTTVALILISILLVVALRSVKIGLISLVPNLIPAAMGFGVWALLVGEVGLALSVVTSMTLGIVVDDTVHFLSKYLRARREKNYTAQKAVIYAFSTVGQALIITSVVLVLGFLILALSNFELNSGMGQLTSIIIVFALAADLLFLPALLIKLEEKENEKDFIALPVTDSAA